MKKLVVLLAFSLAACSTQTTPPAAPDSPELAAWKTRAEGVTIIRDDWGVPHIYGKTDADVVFGLMYAQAEDDFNRVETNFINSQGRLAEAEGEKEIWRDLRMKLFIDPVHMQAQYKESPPWLKALMDAWADGLNFYLATHPNVKPRVITKFEPWMALSFSEGSIGGDIERVNLAQLEAFYSPSLGSKQSSYGATAPERPPVAEAGGGKKPETTTASVGVEPLVEPTGSNGIAVAGMNTASGKAILLINPHTSFFFREEAQMVSEEGLNAYGALTWGQFFIYQGFNDRAGWMHTSSSVDNIDEYLETVTQKPDGSYTYKVGTEERPLAVKKITVPYKGASGMATREFTTYRTHRGPVVRSADGKWVSVRLMEEPLKALIQSFSRTKTRTLDEYKKVMAIQTNSSNNTLYANADGDIAYFHSNFVPERDPRFDWTKPVDGANPATEWTGIHSFDESPNVVNPKNGWVYNTNNYPFSAAGPFSPKEKDFPDYMDAGSENPRGVHAIRVLEGKKGFTVDSLISDVAYSSLMPEFEIQIPPLLKAHAAAPASNPLKAKTAEAVAVLKDWDYRWSASSVPTSVAIFYGEDLWQRVTPAARKANVSVYEYMKSKATAQERLESLAAGIDKLTADFGKWQTPWGEINRFQRNDGAIVQTFDDSKPSTPVMFASARWGSLASFGARAYPGTKKWYGTSGNSFVAVVEFGDRIKARAVTAGGLHSSPEHKHFNNQADRYATGNLREVYFYREQLKGHTEREYKPGQ
jgi:acyl-homoserine-lactone acylase